MRYSVLYVWTQTAPEKSVDCDKAPKAHFLPCSMQEKESLFQRAIVKGRHGDFI